MSDSLLIGHTASSGQRRRHARSTAPCLPAVVTAGMVAIGMAAVGMAATRPALGSDRAAEILDATGVQGGLVVHLGCGDGQLTIGLSPNDRYVVQGLDTDAKNVAVTRQTIRAARPYGKVSARQFDGRHMPYADNVVNLLVSENWGNVPPAEAMRVLVPGGVSYVKREGEWRKTVKPWPDDIDQWTHYLHGPNNNAVADDRVVASPFHAQWVAGPQWARHHNYLSSTSALVSAGGRIFAIIDEGTNASIEMPAKWFLVARDAFNGVVLWKKPIGPWEGHMRPFRSGPPELPRRLVAVGGRVYVTLGYGEPLRELDAATGRVIQTYDETDGTLEMVCHEGVLYLVVGTNDADQYLETARRRGASPPPRGKSLVALTAQTGKVLWTKSDGDTRELLPTTLAVDGQRLLFQSLEHVICLDTTSGKPLWRTARPAKTRRAGWSTPTLLVHDGVVLSADCAVGPNRKDEKSPKNSVEVQWRATARPTRGDESLGELIALSAQDGRELWRCTTAQGYNSPPDVFVTGGLVWASATPNRTKDDLTEGRDLRTGEVKRRIDTSAAFDAAHHHRCYRNKATSRYILLGRTGTEFIDLSGATPVQHHWFRGTCQYGVMPSNGLIYAPPHSCACYIQSKLSGFWALAPKRDKERGARDEDGESSRLEWGPAYDGASAPLSALRSARSADWPSYRHDAARSGATNSGVSLPLEFVWQEELGAAVTAPIVADGILLAASPDTHTVHAFDATSGKPLWSHTVDGRVDSPPTVYSGRVLFGSADGHVYCLRLADGARLWRFRAAPADESIIAFGQVESVWPVTGSVLVQNGVMHSTAGRSSYLDGGMNWVRLDALTGEKLGETRFYSRNPETGEQPIDLVDDVEMPGALPDVLSSDGHNIFLRDKILDESGIEREPDVPHLFSSVGLLDDHWWHRAYWIFGTRVYGRASGWSVVGNYVPSGRLLVLDETTVFGHGRKRIASGDRGLADVPLHLFRADQKVTPLGQGRKLKNNNLALTEHFVPTKVNYHWSQEIPLVVRAMVLAGDTLFVAGPEMAQGVGATEPTFDDRSGALLMAFSAHDGQEQFRLPLDAQPVFDGLIAAGGRLYLSLNNDTVLSLGARP